MIAKITSKGQITLPKGIRERFSIGYGDALDFEVMNDVVIVKPVRASRDVFSLKGMLKPPKKLSDKELNEARKAGPAKRFKSIRKK